MKPNDSSKFPTRLLPLLTDVILMALLDGVLYTRTTLGWLTSAQVGGLKI